MKSFLLATILLATLSLSAQTDLTGSWKAISKVETKIVGTTKSKKDTETYKAGEKTYTFTNGSVTISQGFGKHSETLPVRIDGDKLYIGKPEKNKQPYSMVFAGNKLVLTKTKSKPKNGETKVETEVVTLEK